MGTTNDYRDWSSWGTSGYGSTTTTLGWFNGGTFTSNPHKVERVPVNDMPPLFDVPKI